MNDNEKRIVNLLCDKLPKLKPEQRERAMGVLEGMAIMADLHAAEHSDNISIIRSA